MYNQGEFERYFATIERYLLAEDPREFLKQLPQGSTERLLFDMNETDTTEKFFELAARLGFSDPQSLWLLKLQRTVLGGLPKEQKIKALKALKDATCPYFDYERPTAFSADEQAETFVKGPNALKDEDYSLETFMRENHQPHVNICQYLTEGGLLQLKQAVLLKFKREELQTYIQQVNQSTQQDVFPVLKQYFQLSRAQNAGFNLSSVYCKLTHAQLEALPKHIPEVLTDKTYFASLFKKGFGRELRELSTLPNIETPVDVLVQKRQLIGRIRQWLAAFKTHLVSSFEDQLVIESLQLDLLTASPDLDLFKEYLKRPREFSLFKNDYRNHMQKRTDYSYDAYWHAVHGLEVGRSFIQTRFIEDYLKLLLRDKPEAKTAAHFYDFFEKSYVDGLLHKVLLARGDSLPDLHTLLPKEELDKLATAKELTILDSNKRRFALNEEVVLRLRVKNIKLITAEVYELSTEKHHLSCTSDIDDTVSLDFIEPLTRVTKEVPAGNPYKETTLDFSLAKVLESRPSVYIVDFRGEGVSSRAVIRRGSIVALKQQTLAGVEIKFYQEDSSPIPELDLWCNNRLIHVKDKHVIPYGSNAENLRLIAVWQRFAEVVNVSVPAEQYQLSVSYLYHEENFLVGTKAHVLLQARLLGQGQPVTIKALNNSRVTVTLLNHQNISSSFDVPIEWDHRNEFVLEVPVQTYLKNVRLNVTAKVNKYNGKPQDVTSEHAIIFRDAESDPSFVELFLSKDRDQYKLTLLGRNGEPKPNMNISINITSLLFRNPITKALMTNEKGSVTLGHLTGVSRIDAQTIQTPDVQPVMGSWRIGNWRNETQHP